MYSLMLFIVGPARATVGLRAWAQWALGLAHGSWDAFGLLAEGHYVATPLGLHPTGCSWIGEGSANCKLLQA